MVASKIFISYRRDDSTTITGRIYDWLRLRLPARSVFFDLQSVEYGADFVKRIHRSIDQSKTMLVIIGPHWQERDGGPSQYVRLEVETARSKGLQIVPVLVEGVKLPLPEQLPESLAFLNALNAAEVRSGKDFQPDMEALVKSVGIPLLTRPQRIVRSPGFWMLMGGSAAVLALAVSGILTGFFGTRPDPRVAATATAAVVNRTAEAATAEAAAEQTAAQATAVANQTAVAATATASALVPYTYDAAVPGPNCDPNGQWQLVLNPSYSYQFGFRCLSDRAQLEGGPTFPYSDADYGGSISFSGASGFTYPVRNTTSVDISNMDHSCVELDVPQVSGRMDGLEVCATGRWAVWHKSPSPRANAVTDASGQVTSENVFHVAIVFTGTNVEFYINSNQVYQTPGSDTAGTGANLEVTADYQGNYQDGTADLANFAVTPLP
jgi:hypothetical protein